MIRAEHMKHISKSLRDKTYGGDKDKYLLSIEIVSHELRYNPDWLWKVINSESRHNAHAENPHSGAVGLIQFMPDTARHIGTSKAELLEMNRVEQMVWVEEYYNQFSQRPKSYADLYLLTFYPYAVNKPDSYVFGSEVSESRVRQIAAQNPDRNRDGRLTKKEFREWINR